MTAVPRHQSGVTAEEQPLLSVEIQPAARRASSFLTRRSAWLKTARSAQEWDAALAAGGGGVTAFHRWTWLQGQADMHGWRFEPLVVCRGNDIVGAVPLLLRRRGPFWLSAPVPFIYAGPVVFPVDALDTLEALRRWARLHQVLVTRLDFAPDDTPGVRSALSQAGCHVDEATTYVLDVSGGVDGVRAGLSRSVRKSVQLAHRDGVEISASTESEVVSLLPVLIEEAFTARGLPAPYPPTIGTWAWRQLTQQASISLTAHVGGRPVGLLTAIGERATLYGWTGGALRDVRHLRVSHALHVAVFEAAAEQGYSRVDTLGSVDEGVSQFKASFGSKPVPFLIAQQTTYRSYAAVRDRWYQRRQPATAA